MPPDTAPLPLKEQFSQGLDAPICLTWELTYACNLACVHCLSSSGRRDPSELSPEEARSIVDDLVDMQVFYVNIGGGEPMLRPDFFDLVVLRRRAAGRGEVLDQRHPLTPGRARQLAALDYLDVQISIDGATAATNDAVRGEGSFAAARRAMDNLAAAGFGPFKISVVVTRQNVEELDALAAVGRLLRCPAPPHPAAPVRPWRRLAGMRCTPRRRSSACSTTGCSSVPASSPATPSSTSPRWASRSTG